MHPPDTRLQPVADSTKTGQTTLFGAPMHDRPSCCRRCGVIPCRRICRAIWAARKAAAPRASAHRPRRRPRPCPRPAAACGRLPKTSDLRASAHRRPTPASTMSTYGGSLRTTRRAIKPAGLSPRRPTPDSTMSECIRRPRPARGPSRRPQGALHHTPRHLRGKAWKSGRGRSLLRARWRRRASGGLRRDAGGHRRGAGHTRGRA